MHEKQKYHLGFIFYHWKKKKYIYKQQQKFIFKMLGFQMSIEL